MSARTLSIIFISCGIIISLWYGFSGHFFIIGKLDVEKALKFSPFIGGVVGPLFALSGTLLVYENFRNQQRQMVGNNFFQLLGFHIKIIESIDTQIYGFSDGAKKRDFFDDLSWRIAIDYEGNDILDQSSEPHFEIKVDQVTQVDPKSKVSWEKGLGKLLFIYEYYYHIHQSELSHYLRSLYRIIKYVDQSKLSKKEKEDYIKILRSQLSNYEIMILAYNGLYSYGKKFKILIEKYELLHNLNFELVLNINGYHSRIISDTHILIENYPHLKIPYDEQVAIMNTLKGIDSPD